MHLQRAFEFVGDTQVHSVELLGKIAKSFDVVYIYCTIEHMEEAAFELRIDIPSGREAWVAAGDA